MAEQDSNADQSAYSVGRTYSAMPCSRTRLAKPSAVGEEGVGCVGVIDSSEGDTNPKEIKI